MSHANILVAVEAMSREDAIETVNVQMAPFQEGGEWLGEGTRWDWFQVGGRWTGKLFPDYKPEEDPRNIETCDLCNGTGKRTDMEVKDGCNGCQGTGTSVVWPTSCAKFDGDVIHKKDLPNTDISAYAFLHNKEWHESQRMGFFGMSTKTECEIADETHEGRCIHERATGERIISWNGDDNWNDRYYDRFIRRLSDDEWLIVVDYHV